MTEIEARHIVDSNVTHFWPDWERKDILYAEWISRLRRFDYERAKKVVADVYFEQSAYFKNPPVGKIFLKLKAEATVPRKETPDDYLTTNVYIQCTEPPEKNPKRSDRPIPVFPHNLNMLHDEDYMLGCAEYMKKRFEQLYGGTWIVIRKEKKPDSGLVGDIRGLK